MKRPVLTKPDFVRRYKAGEFGNHSPTWNGLDEMRPEKDALYNIRSREAGGPCLYEIPGRGLRAAWLDMRERYGAGNLYISEMAPHHKQTVQGEVKRSIRHFDLRYTTVKEPMRDAMRKEELFAFGLKAYGIMKAWMNANSRRWLMYLLDEYDDHVVEFTCFTVCWGTLPNFNTVYWEVRKY